MRSFRAALLFVTLAAFGLRVWGLGRQSFWLDEVDAIAMAGEPVLAHLRKLAAIGENGPLYFLLFKGWVLLAGTTEFGARFLSATASSAQVPLLAALARRLTGRPGLGLCAAALAAASPFYVWYGQDAKMYPLYALLALATQYAFLRGWGVGERPSPPAAPVRRWQWWAAYVLCASLALYVHLFAALQVAANTVAGLALWVIRRRGWRGFALATLVLVGPYVPLAAWQAPVLLRGANVGYQPASLRTMVVALLEQLTWHLARPPDRRLLVPLALIALWGAARLWLSRPAQRARASGGSASDANGATLRGQRRARAYERIFGGGAAAVLVLAAWLIVPVLLNLAVQGRVPVFRDRYLIPLLAPFLVLLAAAVAPPWSYGGAVAAGAATFLAAGFGYGLTHRPPNPDFRAAAALVRRLAGPDDQVGFLAGYAERPFEFYYRKAPGRYVKVTLPYTNYPNMDERAGLLAVASSLRGGRWLWVVRFESWLWDSRGLLDEYLANRGARVDLYRDFDGVSVTRYEMPR